MSRRWYFNEHKNPILLYVQDPFHKLTYYIKCVTISWTDDRIFYISSLHIDRALYTATTETFRGQMSGFYFETKTERERKRERTKYVT